jgi:hypothetical protein
LGTPFTVIAAAILMALSALETIVAVLQSGVFCLLSGFYITEVLRRKDALASALSNFYFFTFFFNNRYS